jgi:hypothetical protein
MKLSDYVKNHGLLSGLALFILTGAGLLLFQNLGPLYFDYKEQQRLDAEKLRQQQLEITRQLEAGKKAEQERIERQKQLAEQRQFEAEQNKLLLNEISAMRLAQENALRKQQELAQKEVARQIELRMKDDNSSEKGQVIKAPQDFKSKNVKDPVIVEIKESSREISDGISTKSFAVFGGEKFSLCGHDQFKADTGQGSVRLENTDRSSPLRTGLRNWEKSVKLDQMTELLPGCSVTIKEQTSENVDYLIVSQTTTTISGD